MARIQVRGVGKHGLITDLPGNELALEAWTDLANMKMRNLFAERVSGERETGGVMLFAPRNIFPSPNEATGFWVYCGLAKVAAISPSANPVHYDITRLSGDYTGGISDRWNGVWAGGLLYLNNGVDVPQLWQPISGATLLRNLDNWTSTHRAKVFRSYKAFRLALNITKGAANYPTMVKWSHPADPGSPPPSWDETNPNYLAGEFPLSETPGEVIDCLELGDANMVYKSDAVVVQQFVQSTNVFTWRYISFGTGIAAQQCVTEFKPRLHAVFTQEGDLVVNDGVNLNSVMDKKTLKYIQDNLAWEAIENCFLVADSQRQEVWICYPRPGETICKNALTWNWKDATFGHRELSATYDIKRGLYSSEKGVSSWDEIRTSWKTFGKTRTWAIMGENERTYRHELIGAAYEAGTLNQFNTDDTLAGVDYTAYLERTGIIAYDTDGNGNIAGDPAVVKLLTEIWPEVEAQTGTVIQISVGSQRYPEEGVTWGATKSFVVGEDKKVDFLETGRYLAVRFLCDEQTPWKLYGYSIEVSHDGEMLG